MRPACSGASGGGGPPGLRPGPPVHGGQPDGARPRGHHHGQWGPGHPGPHPGHRPLQALSPGNGPGIRLYGGGAGHGPGCGRPRSGRGDRSGHGIPPGLRRPRHPGHSGAQPCRHRGRGAGRLWQSHAPPPPSARPGPSVPGDDRPGERSAPGAGAVPGGPAPVRGASGAAPPLVAVRPGVPGTGLRRRRWLSVSGVLVPGPGDAGGGRLPPGGRRPLAGGVPVPHGASPARRAVLDGGEAGRDGGPSGERLL